jgi:hypothetical protein
MASVDLDELRALGPGSEPELFGRLEHVDREFLIGEFLSFVEAKGPSGRPICFLVQAVAEIRVNHVTSLSRSLFLKQEPSDRLVQSWQALSDGKVVVCIFGNAERKSDFIARRPVGCAAVALVASQIVYEGSPQHLTGQQDASIAVLCQMWLHFGLRVADPSFYEKKVVRAAGVAWNAGTFKPSRSKMESMVEEAAQLGHDVDLDAASVLRYMVLGQEVRCGLWADDPCDSGRAGEEEFHFTTPHDLHQTEPQLHQLLVDVFAAAPTVALMPREWWLARAVDADIDADRAWCIDKPITGGDLAGVQHKDQQDITSSAPAGEQAGWYGEGSDEAGGGSEWVAPGGGADAPVQFELVKRVLERQRWGPGGATRLLGAVKGWSCKNLFLALHNAASGKVDAFSGPDGDAVAAVRRIALAKKKAPAEGECDRPRWDWADEWRVHVACDSERAHVACDSDCANTDVGLGGTDEEGWRWVDAA